MSDLPSYSDPNKIPGKYTVIETGKKNDDGKRKLKIRFRKRIKTRTRVRKKKSRSFSTRFLKTLQVILLILGVLALFYAGYQTLVADVQRVRTSKNPKIQ